MARPSLTARQRLDRATSEREFQRTVEDYANVRRWEIFHVRPAQTGSGNWVTPTRPGLPDLILIRPPRVVFLELKSQRGSLRAEQRFVINLLQRCPGVDAFVARPSDWDAVRSLLT